MSLAALLACQMGRMHQGTVEIPGSERFEERLAVAKRVAERVYGDGALKKRIVQRFPTMLEEDLVGMFLHWSKVKLGDAGLETVVIQIGIREVADRVPAAEVVEFVRQELLAALAEEPPLPSAPQGSSSTAPRQAAPAASAGR